MSQGEHHTAFAGLEAALHAFPADSPHGAAVSWTAGDVRELAETIARQLAEGAEISVSYATSGWAADPMREHWILSITRLSPGSPDEWWEEAEGREAGS